MKRARYIDAHKNLMKAYKALRSAVVRADQLINDDLDFGDQKILSAMHDRQKKHLLVTNKVWMMVTGLQDQLEKTEHEYEANLFHNPPTLED
jgi:hypothetical protein